MDKQNEEHQAEREFQNKVDSAFTTLENKIHDTKISKSIDPVSEEDIISDNKAKKTGGGRKSRIKAVHVSDSILSTESSEDVLDLYKRTNPEIEKIRASGRALISK